MFPATPLNIGIVVALWLMFLACGSLVVWGVADWMAERIGFVAGIMWWCVWVGVVVATSLSVLPHILR